MKRGLNIMLALAGLLTFGATKSSASTVEMTIVVGDAARTVTITLDEAAAPQTCANFKKLCAERFYSGILFHRIIPDYIVQAGDPLTRDPSKKADWGTGGTPNAIPAEFGKKHVRGAVAAARLGDAKNPTKASHASQFYIALREIPALDGDYTVFGNVTSGLEFLDEIAALASDENNIPLAQVEIRSMKVTEGPGRGVPPIPNLTATTPAGAETTAPPPAPAITTGTALAPVSSTPAPAPGAEDDSSLPPMPRLATTSLEPTGAPASPSAPTPLTPTPGVPAPAPAPAPAAADRGLPPMPRLASDPPEATPSGGLELPSVETPAQPGTPEAETSPAADGSLPAAGAEGTAPAQAPAPTRGKKPEKEPGFFGRFIRRVW